MCPRVGGRPVCLLLMRSVDSCFPDSQGVMQLLQKTKDFESPMPS